MNRPNKKQRRDLCSELNDLLFPLLGEPLPLSLLAAASLSISFRESSGLTTTVEQKATIEQSRDEILRLFEAHIGPYKDVIENARRHCLALYKDDVFCRQTRCDDVSADRYQLRRDIPGPRPDPLVWVGLFLGKETEATMREKEEKEENNGHSRYYRRYRFHSDVEDENIPIMDDIYHNILSSRVPEMDVLVLAVNILRYIEEENRRCNGDQGKLTRFCAVYGLSGAMGNVLSGKYGPVPEELTVDTAIPIHDEDDEENLRFCVKISLPVYAIGAVLGHINVVKYALEDLGAETDVALFLGREDLDLRGAVLFWTILTNQPHMVQFLVQECELGFHSINNYHMSELYHIIFHINGMRDEFTMWRSDKYVPEEIYCSKEREKKRRERFRYCYEEKQKMVRFLIDLGLPFELIVPKIDTTLDADSVDKRKRRARNHIVNACKEYNRFVKKNDRLSTGEFYNSYLKGMWKSHLHQKTTSRSQVQPDAKSCWWDEDCFQSDSDEEYGSNESSLEPL